jgi:single-strand DNA-binding protein
MSVNKVILVGNVGKAPEIRTAGDGKRIAVFPVATSDKWKDRSAGGFKEKTEWHRIVVLSDGLVSIIEKYLKKGSRIYIEGMLQTRKWVDKTSIERYSTEIILQGFNNKLEILDRLGRREDEERNSGSSYDADYASNEDEQEFTSYSKMDDETPFDYK